MNKHHLLQIEDKDLILYIKKQSKKVEENRINYKYLSINIINQIISIILYFLAQFINRYFQTNLPELA